MATPQQIPLQALSLEQLSRLRQNTESEIDYYTKSLSNLSDAQRRLLTSKQCAEVLPAAQGREIMVPLTSSVYVPGIVQSTEKVLVDLGTGYFAEKTPEEAAKYFDRKAKMVRDQIEIAQTQMTGKRQQLESINIVIEGKLQIEAKSVAKEKGQTPVPVASK